MLWRFGVAYVGICVDKAAYNVGHILWRLSSRRRGTGSEAGQLFTSVAVQVICMANVGIGVDGDAQMPCPTILQRPDVRRRVINGLTEGLSTRVTLLRKIMAEIRISIVRATNAGCATLQRQDSRRI